MYAVQQLPFESFEFLPENIPIYNFHLISCLKFDQLFEINCLVELAETGYQSVREIEEK